MKKITDIDPGSIAERLGIREGDELLTINGITPVDVFDYRYQMTNSRVTLEISRNGIAKTFNVKKRESADLGLVFDSGLMDEPRACKNACVFCFIDQLPKGMRKPLYFKDDDVRLSFLSGNYVTLSNLSDTELQRLIDYKLSPVNISVHATDPQTRVKLMKNPHCADIMEKLSRFAAHNITMNFQIVLVKGVNDSSILERSIEDLAAFMPLGNSLSIVPVGLSRHRERLDFILPFTKQDALDIIRLVEACQARFSREYDNPFVYAADEFYILADLPIPPAESYNDFPQIENGVGSLAAFMDEFEGSIDENIPVPTRKYSVATGVAALPFIEKMAGRVGCSRVYAITNNFFGERITVSGLVTGQDLIEQLKGKDLGDELLIPENMLKDDSDVFLDDVTVGEVADALGVTVTPLPVLGDVFYDTLIT